MGVEGMSGASIETTLELWASSLRDVKRRMRPLFAQARVALSAENFLEGLLGEERRKTGWMISRMSLASTGRAREAVADEAAGGSEQGRGCRHGSNRGRFEASCTLSTAASN